MGVTGLWKLIESSGKPVAFETLEDIVIVIVKTKDLNAMLRNSKKC